jgi:hypothetical protein
MTERLTGAQRQAQFRKSGRQVSVVLRDDVAILALDELASAAGGVSAAITAALKHAAVSGLAATLKAARAEPAG